MTIYYILQNNQIDDIIVENTDYRFSYGIYRSDNYFFANHMGIKATYTSIMLDLKEIYKRKNNGNINFAINGLTKNFLDKVKTMYNLSKDYIHKNLKVEYVCKLPITEVIYANDLVEEAISQWDNLRREAGLKI